MMNTEVNGSELRSLPAIHVVSEKKSSFARSGKLKIGRFLELSIGSPRHPISFKQPTYRNSLKNSSPVGDSLCSFRTDRSSLQQSKCALESTSKYEHVTTTCNECILKDKVPLPLNLLR